MRNGEVRHPVLDAGNRSLIKVISIRRLRFFGHTLCFSGHHLPSRALSDVLDRDGSNLAIRS